MAVTTEIWYINDTRTVVNFTTAIVNGVAQIRILRARGVLTATNSTATVGDLSYTLFANSGDVVSGAKLAAANAERSSNPLPAAIADPNSGGNGGGGSGVDEQARSTAAAAQSTAANASNAASMALATANGAKTTADGAASAAASADTKATNAGTAAATAQTSATAANASVSSLLFNQAKDPDSLLVGSVTRNSDGTTTGFNVLWPDGATGVFAGAPSLTSIGYVDSYTITHVLGGVTTTYTQPSFVRDPATNVITSRPAITVANGAPVTPVIPTATTISAVAGAAGSGLITVSSTGGTNVASRALYRSASLNPISTGSVVATSMPFTDNVTAKVTYYYQEVVTSTTGHTAASNVPNAMVGVTPVIPTADTLTATAGPDGSGQITITGSGRTNTDSIAIYRGTSTPVSTSGAPVAADLPFVDTDLTNAIAYYYVELATSTTGDTAQSNTVTATVANAPAPTTAPTLTLGSPTVTTQPLTYTAVTNASNYSVEHKLTSGSTWVVDTTTATGTSFTVTTLTPNTSYDYRVRASNANGFGPYSTVVTGSTAADTVAPTAPTTVTATPGDGQVTLTFSGATDNVGVTGYRVYNAASSGTLVTTGASSPIVITGLTNGTSYIYYVSAVDAAGNESGRTASNAVTPVTETTIFTDSFDRADTTGGGTLGNNWVDSSNRFKIVSGRVAPVAYSGSTTTTDYAMQPTPAQSGSKLRVSIDAPVSGTVGTTSPNYFGVTICEPSVSDFTERYALSISGSGTDANKLFITKVKSTANGGNARLAVFDYTFPTGAITIDFGFASISGGVATLTAKVTANGSTQTFTATDDPAATPVTGTNGYPVLTGRYYGFACVGSGATNSTSTNMRLDNYRAYTI